MGRVSTQRIGWVVHDGMRDNEKEFNICIRPLGIGNAAGHVMRGTDSFGAHHLKFLLLSTHIEIPHAFSFSSAPQQPRTFITSGTTS